MDFEKSKNSFHAKIFKCDTQFSYKSAFKIRNDTFASDNFDFFLKIPENFSYFILHKKKQLFFKFFIGQFFAVFHYKISFSKNPQ